jgi:hypothetical protein
MEEGERVGVVGEEATEVEAVMVMEEEVMADMKIRAVRANYYRFFWWDCWVYWASFSTSDRPRLRVGVAWMKTISQMVNN